MCTVSGIYLYEVLIEGKDAKLDFPIVAGLLITLFFLIMFVVNIYWAIKGEDSIFKRKP